MKIWVDDTRMPSSKWEWCKTSQEAIMLLIGCKLFYESGYDNQVPEIMSLDHDLGGDDTTRPIILWMRENEFWPTTVVVHSQNPVGREWLEGMIERYKV